MSDAKDRTAPMIGKFSGPATNAPRTGLRRKDEEESPTTPEAQEETPKTYKRNPKTSVDVQKEFLEGLEEIGLDIEKARGIMDEVLQHGYYKETHTLRNKELIVRSRGYRDTLRAQRYLEVENPTYATNMDEIIMRYNTAASLIQYGDRTFEHPEDVEDSTDQQIEEAFEKRRRFLETLPSIMVGKLNTVVYNMDIKLSAVFAEGAPEDF